jgi:hypothetical protein
MVQQLPCLSAEPIHNEGIKVENWNRDPLDFDGQPGLSLLNAMGIYLIWLTIPVGRNTPLLHNAGRGIDMHSVYSSH